MSRPRLLLTAGVLAVAAVAAVVLTSGDDATAPDPERVLRDYLEAARTGRVDDALRIAGAERPTGSSATFLSATRKDWRVGRLEPLGEVTDTARFAVTIGNDEQGANGEVALRRDGDRWRVDRPLTAVEVPPSPLWYDDVNGTTAPRARPAMRMRYLVLPGVYEFYRDTPTVDVRVAPLVALPGSPDLAVEFAATGTTSTGEPILFTLTETGAAAATQLVDTHVDQCAARAEPQPAGCPFGADVSGLSGTDLQVDGRVLRDVAVTWTVLSRPGFGLDRWHPDAFQVARRPIEPGRVRLSGTGTDPAGARVPFTMECDMDLTAAGLIIGVTADGTVTLDYYDRRYLGNDPPTVATCR